MAYINDNYMKLKQSYLFSEIAHRVATFTEAHPDQKIIRLGIGDVTKPLAPSVISAMTEAVQEMSQSATFKGYGPEQGYAFLREAIANYYKERGTDVDASEIFVSDGAKSDTGNIGDILSTQNKVLITDPVYPVYVDTNIMAGREISFLDCNESNGFLPAPPEAAADIIYLCSPNNPTGSVLNHDQLKAWVDYALAHKAIILFDAAYESYITDSTLPRSIYEIPGAKECAIEFCSLSKTAGFTGTRCGYTVVPHALKAMTSCGESVSVHALWNRRQTTKFNGVPYIVQKGAAAIFTAQGQKEVKELVAYYMNNAATISSTLDELGITYYGGINSPYIWLKCPEGLSSWELFDKLLNEIGVVGTPGVGFGDNGEGYFRLTAFGDADLTVEACKRLKTLFGK